MILHGVDSSVISWKEVRMSATTYTLGVSWEMWSISQACAALCLSEFEILQLQRGVAEMVGGARTMPSG